MNGAIKSYLNENAISIEDFAIEPKFIAELIHLIQNGKISNSIAEQKIFPEMTKNPTLSPLKIAEENNLIQESNDDAIVGFIQQVFDQNPNEVNRYKNGEKQLTGFLMGQLMKVSKGKADPKKANQLMRELLEK